MASIPADTGTSHRASASSGVAAFGVAAFGVAAFGGAAFDGAAPAVTAPSDAAAVRRRNLGLVLRHIADHGPCARTEIAAATGLAHGSVTALVSDLLERGLITEDAVQRSGTRGRPGRPVRLAPTRALILTVQIGADRIRVRTADLSGATVRETTAPVRTPIAPDRMADTVAALLQRAVAATVGASEWPRSASGAPSTGLPFPAAVDEPSPPHPVVAGAGEFGGAATGVTAMPGRARSDSDGAGAAHPGSVAPAGDRWDAAVVRVVVAMAGPVRDDAARTVVVAPDFGWLGPVRLGELIAARMPGLGCAVEVVNDGNAAALAEFHARGRRDRVVLIEAGTGIGGGVVVDGRIETGSHGVAGEPGHMPVGWDGPECACGARGCLVVYAGPEAVLGAAGLRDMLRDQGVCAASAELVTRLRAGDGPALTAVEVAGRAIGAAVQSITALLDVDAVVLGGTLAQWFPWLAPGVESALAGRRALLPGLALEVVPAVLGQDAILLGAVEFARRAVLSDPAVVPPLRAG